MDKRKRELKFHAVGDLHFSKRHYDRTLKAMEGVEKILEKDSIDILVIMGDVLDRYGYEGPKYQFIAEQWFLKLSRIALANEAKTGKKTFISILIGNHDRPHEVGYFSDVHPFRGIRETNQLIIVNKPRAKLINGIKILFMPYVPPGTFVESFHNYLKSMHELGKWSKIKSIKEFDMIYAHQEFYGSPYNGAVTSTKGDKWPLEYPMVISGHIHRRTRLQKNILYTGALYPTSIGEDNDKGVIVGTYSPDDRNLDFLTVSVVKIDKVVREVSGDNQSEILEMIALDRENTVYIVKCDPYKRKDIELQISKSNKNIKVIYDVTTPEANQEVLQSYDEIVKSKITSEEQTKLFEEICSMSN